MDHRGELSILDALENLNTIVDAESLDEIEVTDDSLLIAHKKDEEEESLEDSYWVQAGPDEQMFDAIQKTFRSVHHYLQSFYQKLHGTGETQRLVEGINTVMVLVGEAAKKTERFGTLFKERVTEIPEYKELQNFYRNKVIQESFRDFARTPISKEKISPAEVKKELGEGEVEEVEGVHILNDINVIKNDHLYELFYLKNETGHPFYTYSLARNIKLACDFGEFANEYFGEDPLLQLKNWEDKSLQIFATRILELSEKPIERFYKNAMKFKGVEAVSLVNKALIALMMASNPRNLIRQFAFKGCHLYFSDFLFFIREVLHNREYQKLLMYSPPNDQVIFRDLLNLVSSLIYGFFTVGGSREELQNGIQHLIERTGIKKGLNLSETIENASRALQEVLKKHPSGPVFKALDLIREHSGEIFDPLKQGNIPEPECVLRSGKKEVFLFRIPAPVQQEMIHRAVVAEEFKAYLHALHMKQELHLLINFQDRTSWQEHARCFVIEELSRKAEFATICSVVTMAKDTNFYHQSHEYENLNQADEFLDHFFHHLDEENTGYYFPKKIKKELFPDFIKGLLNQIHETFFDGKKILSQKERCDLIQLAYHFIELKLIEFVEPARVSLISKDSLDIGGTSNVGLIALLAVGKVKSWSEKDLTSLITICFGPTLMNRERSVHPERIERLVSMIHLMEQKGNYLKSFSNLYRNETLEMMPHFFN